MIAVPMFLLCARDLREIGKVLNDRCAELMLELRHNAVANSIAGKTTIDVGGILAPLPAAQARFQLKPVNSEEGPDNFSDRSAAWIFEPQPRMNARQASHPGAPQNSKKHRLGLIVEGVSGGDFRNHPSAHQPTKIFIAQSPRGSFDSRLPGLKRQGAGVQFEIMTPRQFSDELFVLVRFLAAQLMIHVCDRENHAQFCSQVEQQVQQRDRIRSAGDRRGDPVSRLEEPPLANCHQYLLSRLPHQEMVTQGMVSGG